MQTTATALSFTHLQSAIARPPLMVAPETTVMAALARMDATDSSYVLVVDSGLQTDGSSLLGLLTTRDLVRLNVQAAPLDQLPIQAVMSQPVIALNEADLTTIDAALTLFQQHQIHHLPVLDDHDHVVGLIERGFLTELLAQHVLQLEAETIELSESAAIAAQPTRMALTQQNGVEPPPLAMLVQAEERHADQEGLNQQLQQTLEELSVAEEELRQQNLHLESERLKYQDLFNFAPDGYLVTNPAGIIQSANQAIAAQLAANQSFLVGKPLVVFVAQLDHSLFYNQLQQSLLHNHNQTWEITFQPHRGEPFPAEVTVVPIYGKTHTVSGLRWLVREISERKRSEAVLRQYERVVSATTDGIALIDQSYVYQLVNHVYLERYGQPLEAIVGHSVEAILGETVFQSVVQPRLDRCLAGEIQQYEAWFDYPDSGRRFVRVTHAPYFEFDGTITGVVVGTHDLTALKQAEAALQEREQFLSSIYEGVEQAIFTLDVLEDGDFRYVAFNPAAEQLAGKLTAEIRGQAPGEKVRPHYTECIQSGVSITYEECLVFQETSTWWLTTLNPIRDASSRICRIVGTSTSITQRKQAEALLEQLNQELEQRVAERTAALQESQRFIQQIADASPNILYLYDLQEQRNVYVNREVATALGYTSEVISTLGADLFTTLMHPNDLSLVLAQQERIKASRDKTIFEIEYRMRHANGKWRWFYSRDAIFSQDDTGQVKQIIGTAQDISDRKHLEQTQNRLIAILEASTDYMGMSDLTGNIIWNNTAFKRICGLEHDADVRQRCIADYHPQWAVELILQQGLPHAIANGSWLGETALLAADGQEIPLSQLILAHKSPQGVVEFFSTIARDMRVRRAHEQQLERTNAELLRATRLKDEFLANMSHELRTPLNAILGMSEGLQEDVFGSLNDRQKGALATVDRSGRHLLSLINDILEVSKIAAGKLELDVSSVSVNQLCTGSLSFVKQQALKKQIELITVFPPTNLEDIIVDERRIRQVLINLLTNAVKFTSTGGRVTLRVQLETTVLNLSERVSLQRLTVPRASLDNPVGACCQLQDYDLCFSVIDTGIGITPVNQAKLFQPFVQLDSSLNRQYEGTGLGLTLVKQIVELHGGSVSLQSAPGQGSCFTVRLPYMNAWAKKRSLIKQTNFNPKVTGS